MSNFDINFYKRVYAVVQKIPKGKVANYGMVAQATGFKNLARQVGFALHANPQPDQIPCYRVVFADGSLSPAFAFGGINMQRKLLREEGVIFDKNGKVLPEFFCDISEITI